MGGNVINATTIPTPPPEGHPSYPPLAPLEFGSLDDFLSNDPHFASSFRAARYDDLAAAHPLPGLLRPVGAPPHCVLFSKSWPPLTRFEFSVAAAKYPPSLFFFFLSAQRVGAGRVGGAADF
jgi:hypothetical protein